MTQWYQVINKRGQVCGKLKTDKPDDNYAVNMGMTLNPIGQDQKTVAERKWQQGKLAPIAQKPCDHGLFSDDANQSELF